MPKDKQVLDANRIDWTTSKPSETDKDADYSYSAITISYGLNIDKGFLPKSTFPMIGIIYTDYADELTSDAAKRIEIKKAHTFYVWKDRNGNVLNNENNFVVAPEPPYGGLGVD